MCRVDRPRAVTFLSDPKRSSYTLRPSHPMYGGDSARNRAQLRWFHSKTKGCVMQNLRTTAIVMSMAAMFLGAGCGNKPGQVPDTVTVELPDGTTSTVTLGAGVPSLSSSTWEFFITGEPDSSSAQSLPFLVISFGPEGELTQFDENSLAPEIFGDTIYFDGQSHSTNQAGLSYVAGTYGAETADATGFSFVGKLSALAAGFPAANATATASGTFEPDDPDTMSGIFEFSVRATVDFIPNVDMDEAYTFIAHRVTE